MSVPEADREFAAPTRIIAGRGCSSSSAGR